MSEISGNAYPTTTPGATNEPTPQNAPARPQDKVTPVALPAPVLTTLQSDPRSIPAERNSAQKAGY